MGNSGLHRRPGRPVQRLRAGRRSGGVGAGRTGRKEGGDDRAEGDALQGGRPPPSCRILFISRSAEKGLERTLAALGPGTLTVSDIPGFAGKGGIIGFFMDDKKVRIEVNPRRAGEAGLKLSPRLLQVSKIIGDPR